VEEVKEIRIRGKSYEVKTDLSDEDLNNVVDMVNMVLEESEKVLGTPDFEAVSILALLSLAEKAYLSEKKNKITQKRIYNLLKRCEEL
jgi:cell division protein ZapA (FtsZ GTPase activity inhibitor)